MNITDLILGSLLAIIMGAFLGYILYRFRIILEGRRLTKNVDKKIEKQENRELLIGGIKVKKNRSYFTGGNKVNPGEEELEE